MNSQVPQQRSVSVRKIDETLGVLGYPSIADEGKKLIQRERRKDKRDAKKASQSTEKPN